MKYVKTAVIAWKSKYSKSIELHWFNANGKVQRTMQLIMQVNAHNTIESQCYCCWLNVREKGSYGTLSFIMGKKDLGKLQFGQHNLTYDILPHFREMASSTLLNDKAWYLFKVYQTQWWN